jgi:adenylosuccinate synthase
VEMSQSRPKTSSAALVSPPKGETMSRIIVALSGPVASGKSTLARGLQEKYGATVISTRQLLQARARAESTADLGDRRSLQEFGEALDEATDGNWVADDIAMTVQATPEFGIVVIDAVRVSAQLDALRRNFGRRVWHVHVHNSSPAEVAGRYADRARSPGPLRELPTYQDVLANRTEAQVPHLAGLADVVLDTHRNTPSDVLVRCAARIGLLSDLGDQLVDVLVGGEYGSEGKGNIAFYLAPEYDVLVRVGGPNAGHRVPTVVPFTHRSLPSGTLANPTAKLAIGAGATLRVDVLLKEISDCQLTPERLFIDPQAMVITDDDRAAEAALVGAIGSTGQGVGHATSRRILSRGQDEAAGILAGGVPSLAPFLSPVAQILDDAYSHGSRILLEGTQGTGLSLFHGEYPYVTSRDTTAAGVLSEAGISARRVRRTVMVCRTYPIRVGGNSGPIGQSKDISWEEIADRAGLAPEDIDERGSVSGNVRRVAEFDWTMLRRSAELNGVTDVALTFVDYLNAQNRNAFRYDQLDADTIRMVEEVEQVAGAPTTLIATNFSQRSVIDRRDWRGRTTS